MQIPAASIVAFHFCKDNGETSEKFWSGRVGNWLPAQHNIVYVLVTNMFLRISCSMSCLVLQYIALSCIEIVFVSSLYCTSCTRVLCASETIQPRKTRDCRLSLASATGQQGDQDQKLSLQMFPEMESSGD